MKFSRYITELKEQLHPAPPKITSAPKPQIQKITNDTQLPECNWKQDIIFNILSAFCLIALIVITLEDKKYD